MSGLNFYKCRWTETDGPLMPILAASTREAALMFSQISYAIGKDGYKSEHDILFVTVCDRGGTTLYHYEIEVQNRPTFTVLEVYQPTAVETLEAITAKEVV